MTKAEFLTRLDQALADMPRHERENALYYYAEYIDDAGPENEQAIFEKLGAPELVAEKLLRDSNIRMEKTKKTMSRPWAVVLSILAAPIAIPLIAAGFCVFLALLIVLFVLILVAFILAMIPGILLVAFFACGVAMLGIGLYALFTHFATGLYFLGGGLSLVGLGGLVFAAYRTIPGKIARSMPGLMGWIKRVILWPFRRRRAK